MSHDRSMGIKMNREKPRRAASFLSTMLIVCVLFFETISVGRMILDESKLWIGIDKSELWVGVHESKHQGPWSKCLYMTSFECIKYIKECTAKLQSPHKMQIIRPGDTVSLDLDPRRVRIYVDDNNTVVEIPERG